MAYPHEMEKSHPEIDNKKGRQIYFGYFGFETRNTC